MATHINLLDWRAEIRKQRREQFMALFVIGLVIAAAFDFAVVRYFDDAIDFQHNRNEFLKQQIAETEKQIKEIQELEKTRQNLLARMHVVEELQRSRAATVHFFDEIVNTLPEGVYLTSLKQQGAIVSLDGVAESNGRVSSYMKNFEGSQWFADPRLGVIQAVDNNKQHQSKFSLTVKNLTVAQPKAEGEEDGQ